MAKDPLIIPSLITPVRGNADVIFNQFGTRVLLTLGGRGKQALPDNFQNIKIGKDLQLIVLMN